MFQGKKLVQSILETVASFNNMMLYLNKQQFSGRPVQCNGLLDQLKKLKKLPCIQSPSHPFMLLFTICAQTFKNACATPAPTSNRRSVRLKLLNLLADSENSLFYEKNHPVCKAKSEFSLLPPSSHSRSCLHNSTQ